MSYAAQKIKDLTRSARAAIHSYPEVKKKAKDATNSDNWGPTDPQKQELTEFASEDHESRALIMRALWKRIGDESQYWQHPFKAMDVFEYFLLNDVPAMREEIRQHRNLIEDLTQYSCAKDSDPAMRANLNQRVRVKAQRMLQLLEDDELLEEGRARFRVMKTRTEGMDARSAPLPTDPYHSHEQSAAPSQSISPLGRSPTQAEELAHSTSRDGSGSRPRSPPLAVPNATQPPAPPANTETAPKGRNDDRESLFQSANNKTEKGAPPVHRAPLFTDYNSVLSAAKEAPVTHRAEPAPNTPPKPVVHAAPLLQPAAGAPSPPSFDPFAGLMQHDPFAGGAAAPAPSPPRPVVTDFFATAPPANSMPAKQPVAVQPPASDVLDFMFGSNSSPAVPPHHNVAPAVPMPASISTPTPTSDAKPAGGKDSKMLAMLEQYSSGKTATQRDTKSLNDILIKKNP